MVMMNKAALKILKGALTLLLLLAALAGAYTPNRFANSTIAANLENEYYPDLCPASSYGAYTAGQYVVYRDDRFNPRGDVKIARLDNAGNVVASSTVNTDTTDYVYNPLVTASGAFAAVCWERKDTIYMARRYHDGTPYIGTAWAGRPNGKPIITTGAYTKYDLTMIGDGTNHFICWRERRGSYYSIYVQKVDYTGNILWTGNGVEVYAAPTFSMYSPKMVLDGTGGLIVVWYDARYTPNYEIHAQRISSSGTRLWTSTGVGLASSQLSGSQTKFQICSDESSGVFIAYNGDNARGDSLLMLQRINLNGGLRVASGGIALCSYPSNHSNFALTSFTGVSYGKEVYAVWEDDRNYATTGIDLYATRAYCSSSLYTSGLWSNATGKPVCTASGNQRQVRLADDGGPSTPGAVFAWTDERQSITEDHIYASRLDYNSSLVSGWTANGSAISQRPGTHGYQKLILYRDDVNGNDLVFLWSDYDGASYNLYAQKENQAGSFIDRVAPGIPNLYPTADQSYTAPSLSWNMAADAQTYFIQVSSSPAFSTLAVNDSVSSSYVYYNVPNNRLISGTWYWHVRARDDGLNLANWSATDEFRIDTIPPRWGSFSVTDNQTIVSQRPYLSARVSDAGPVGFDPSTIVMTLDGLPVSHNIGPTDPAIVHFTPTVDLSYNWHRVTWFIRDSVYNGGFADTAVIDFYIDYSDMIGPTFSNQVPASGALVNTLRPLMSAVASDPSGIDGNSRVVELDYTGIPSAYDPGTQTISATPTQDLTDGLHTVRMAVRDSSMKTNSGEIMWVFRVDTRAPNTPAFYSLPALTTLDTVQAGGESIDAGDSGAIAHIYNNGMFLADTQLFFSPGPGKHFWGYPVILAQGRNVIAAYLTDLAGNNGSWDSIVVYRDDIAPDAPVILEGELLTATRSLSVLVPGTAERQATVHFYVNSVLASQFMNMGTYDTFGVVLPLSYGRNSIEAYQNDSAGNSSALSLPVSVLVDTLAPVVDSTYPRNGDTLISLTPELRADVRDLDESGCRSDMLYAVLDGDTVPAAWDGISRLTYQVPADLADRAWHYFKTQLTDQAGNTSAWDSVAFYTDRSSNDNIPPSIGTLAPINTVNTAQPVISAIVFDAENGLDDSRTQLFIDNVLHTHSYSLAENKIFFTPTTDLTQGMHRCSLLVADASTNHNGAWTAWDFNIDSYAPSAPSLTLNATATNASSISLSGTTEAGATIELYVNGGATPVASLSADAAGAFLAGAVPLTYGNNCITAKAIDSVFNHSVQSGCASIVMDNLKPQVTATSPRQGDSVGTRTPIVTFSVTDNDGVGVDPDSVWIFRDSLPVSRARITFANNVFELNDLDNPGTHNSAYQVRIVFADTLGNRSDTTSLSFRIDTSLSDNTPPAFSQLSPARDTVIGSTTVTVGANVSDINGIAASSLRLVVDGSDLPYTWDGSRLYGTPDLSGGTHTAKVVAADASAAANRDSLSWNFSIDTTAPAEPTLDSLSPYTGSPSLSPGGTAEARSRVEYFVNGASAGSIQADTAGRFIAGISIAEGQNRITVQATDPAGNRGPMSRARTVTLDTRQPFLADVYPKSNEVVGLSRPELWVIGADSGSGLYFIDIKVRDNTHGGAIVAGNVEWLPAQNKAIWRCVDSLLDSSAMTLEVGLYDLASNYYSVRTPFSTNFNLADRIPPAISAMQPTGLLSAAQPEISAVVSDPSGIDLLLTKLFVDTLPVVFNHDSAKGKIYFQASAPMAEGQDHKVELRAYDTRGNSASRTWTFRIDATPPVAPVLDPLPPLTRAASLTLSGTTEAGAAIEALLFGKSAGTGQANAAGAFQVTGVALNEGENVLYARATDAAGNTGPLSTPDTVVLDSRAPYAVSSSPRPGDRVSSRSALSFQLADTGAVPSGVDSATVIVWLDRRPIKTLYQGSIARVDTPVILAQGAHQLSVHCADKAGNRLDLADFSFNVDSAYVDNQPPVFSGFSPANNAVVNTRRPLVALSVTDAVSSVPRDSITMLLNGAPASGFNYESMTGRIFYTPAADLPDSNLVIVTAKDSAGNLGLTQWRFRIDVTPPAKPRFLTSADTLVASDIVTLRAATEAGSRVRLFKDGLQVREVAAVLTDTFALNDVSVSRGLNDFTLTALDPVGNASALSDTLRVIYNVSRPVISNKNPGLLSTKEDSILTLQVIASDADNPRLYFSILVPALPATFGLSIDSLGLLSWRPTLAYSNQPVQIRVTDGFGLSDTTNIFLITATPVNDKPIIRPVADTVIVAGDTVRIDLTMTDEDNATLPAFGLKNPPDPSFRMVRIRDSLYQLLFFADSILADTIRLYAYDGQDSAFGKFHLRVRENETSVSINPTDTTRVILASGGDTVRLILPVSAALTGKTIRLQRLVPGPSDILPASIPMVGAIYEITGADSGFRALVKLPIPSGFSFNPRELTLFTRQALDSGWLAIHDRDTTTDPARYVCGWTTHFSQFAIGLDTVPPRLVVDSSRGGVIYAALTENIPNPVIQVRYRGLADAGSIAPVTGVVATGSPVRFMAAPPLVFDNLATNGYVSWINVSDGIHTVQSVRNECRKPVASPAIPPSRLSAGGFRMVSLPFSADSLAAKSVFSGLISSDTMAWRIGRWQSSGTDAGLYIDQVPGQSHPFLDMAPGVAVWVYAKTVAGPLALGTQAQTTPLRTGSSDACNLSLVRGWNQVGNPYNRALPLSWLIFDTAVVQNVFWGYSALTGNYYQADSLKPFEGYFVLANGPATIEVPSVPPSGPITKARAVAPAWSAHIRLSLDGLSAGVIVGEAEEATSGRDAGLDFVGPPAGLGRSVELTLPHDDWGAWASGRYIQDVKNLGVPGNIWTLRAADATGGGLARFCRVSADATASLPQGRSLVAWLPESDVLSDLSADGFDLALAPGARSAEFKILAGTDAYIAEKTVGARMRPKESKVAQNAPNPFNPATAIRYQLKDAGAVTLNVYDSRGRLVRTLLRGALRNFGYHEVIWDGKNSQGQGVASGLYFYRFQSGRVMMTKRMLLAR